MIKVRTVSLLVDPPTVIVNVLADTAVVGCS